MTQQQGWLAGFYALIAVVALIATWSQNLTYFAGEGALAGGPGLVFLQDTRVNPASRSITVDLGLLLLASVAFMVIEARRLGVRFVWLYILFGFMVAISVTFPLFMIARELRIAKAPDVGGAWALKAVDILGLLVVTAMVAGLSWFVLS